MTPTKFKNAVNKQLSFYLDLMEKEWQFRPNIVVHAVPKVRIHAYRTVPDWLDSTKTRLQLIANFFINAKTGDSYNKRFVKVAAKLWTQIESRSQDYSIKEYRLRTTIKPKGCENDKVTYFAEPFIHVYADFNLDNFEHEGQGFYVNEGNMATHRNPKNCARLIAAEISGHRNTCQRCGTGIAPLWARANNRYYDPKFDLNIPPDGVEKVLHPRLSKILMERLNACETA